MLKYVSEFPSFSRLMFHCMYLTDHFYWNLSQTLNVAAGTCCSNNSGLKMHRQSWHLSEHRAGERKKTQDKFFISTENQLQQPRRYESACQSLGTLKCKSYFNGSSQDPAIGSLHVDGTSNLQLVLKSAFCATRIHDPLFFCFQGCVLQKIPTI